MGRRPRAAAIAVLALTACAPEVDSFAVVEPAASVELVPAPGETVSVAWTYEADADDARELLVAVEAVPAGADAGPWLGSAPLFDRRLAFVVPPGPGGAGATFIGPSPQTPPAGVYQLVATVEDEHEALAADTAAGLLVVRGAWLRDDSLSFRGSDPDRDIWMTTVTASVARVTLTLWGAETWTVDEGTIASDLAPVGRVVTFTGLDVDGAPIPAGTYLAQLTISDLDGGRALLVDTAVIDWQP